MRLFELTRYKEHPVYKAVQGLKPKDYDSKWDMSYDLDSMRTLTKALQEHGWHAIGHGNFSNVYTNNEYPYMVKIFVNDPGYLKYFNLVKESQGNPHVPRVRGKFMKVGTEGYVVRLEPLEPLTGEDDAIFKRYITPKLTPTLDNLLEYENEEFLEQKHPRLAELMNSIYSQSSTLDWHAGNLMKRGKTLVVTDPYCY